MSTGRYRLSRFAGFREGQLMEVEHFNVRVFFTLLVLMVLVVLGGCASRPINEPIPTTIAR